MGGRFSHLDWQENGGVGGRGGSFSRLPGRKIGGEEGGGSFPFSLAGK